MTSTSACLRVRARVHCGEEIAMGPGKADLLDAIAREGSISGAGKILGMSYRRTWLLVDTMNRCWREPLVETTPGGGKGRGACLTGLGREVLDHYRNLQRRIMDAAQSAESAALFAAMRSAPKPSQRD